MRILEVVMDAAVRLGQATRPLFGPLWKGWDWLTGMPQQSLVPYLWAGWGCAGLVRDLSSSPIILGLDLAMMAMVWGWLRAAESTPVGDVLSIETESAHQKLAAFGGYFFVVFLLGILPPWSPFLHSAGRGFGLLMCQAAISDHPGSGKTCVDRLVEGIRKMWPTQRWAS